MLTGWRGFVVAGVAAVLATAALLGVALADKRAAETGTGADLLNVDGVPSGGGAPAYESLFLAELNAAQDGDGSWSRDLNATALSGYAVAMDDNKPDAALESLNWTMGNYDSANLSYAAGAYLVLTSAPGSTNASYDAIGQDYNGAFRAMVAADLSAAQEANGSWGGDISSTALATYALAKTYGHDNATAERGAAWLEGAEPRTAGEQAKAALAAKAAGGDPSENLEALAGNQSDNGSFGSFRDTAWAAMALSESGEYGNLLKAREGVTWLRGRDALTDEELALGALAEQYYFEAAERYSIEADAAPALLLPWQYAVGGFVLSSLGLMGLLFSRLRDEDVMDGVRRQIFDHIERNPGEHVAGITRKLSISSSSARYHLLVLEYNEKVVAHKSGKLKHYYSSHNGYGIYTNGFEYKDVLASLKNETARKIVKFIIERGGANQKSIAEHLGLHASTVGWHARRLKSAHVIVRARSGKEIMYSVNGEIEVAKVVSVLERPTS